MIFLGNTPKSVEEAQRKNTLPAPRDHSVVDRQCRVSDARECILQEQHQAM